MKTKFITDLNTNYKNIYNVYKRMIEISENGHRIAPACEWLLDNFYVIERQVRDIENSFSKNLSKILPMGANGEFRIYFVAQNLIHDCAGKVDEEYITEKITTYQQNTVLDITELFSLPIMLKAGIISQISKICDRTLNTQLSYVQAEKDASLLESGENAILFEHKIKKGGSYLECLVNCLKKCGGKNFNTLSMIDEILKDSDENIENIVSAEYERQASRQVKMGNLISSLTIISGMDICAFFESVSLVEEILKTDPSGIYNQMDTETKENYRNKIVDISLKYQQKDIEVTKVAISLCEGMKDEKNHVGYYLIDEGLTKLITVLTGKKPRLFTPKQYISIICAATLAPALAISLVTNSIVPCIISLLPFSNIVTGILNFIICHKVPPKKLPKLKLTEIPPTLIVIPTLLTSTSRVMKMLDNLEVYYLSNKEENLYFALAGDFKDSNTKTEDGDDEIVSTGIEKVRLLNEKYKKEIFFYLNRERTYDENQKRWMGFERKRGALLELNKMIAEGDETSYNIITSKLPDVKYIITLDADTLLPKDGALKLIGCMEHPLCKPYIDKNKNIVVKGYGMLQPGVGIDIESANKSLFSKIFAGGGGIDPYSSVCSDIYQDLFGESIFTGKGIYNVNVCNRILKNAIPKNTVLSHDLLEGSYLRCGFVSDVRLIDGYPGSYLSYFARNHRWMRGDWQLLQWLRPRIKNFEGKQIKNPLNTLSKWKILDNLRRSMLPVADFILIMFSFIKGNGIFSAVAIISLLIPVIMQIISNISGGRKSERGIITGVKGAFLQSFILIVLLCHNAYTSADAALRALYRSLISKKNVLQWVTAADSERMQKNSIFSYYSKMFISPLGGIAAIIMVSYNKNMMLWGIIIGSLFIAAPYIAYLISQECNDHEYKLNDEEEFYLRITARKTWHYFEEFMDARHGFIPPDNFQENPPNGRADRASPTNMGITLMAVLTAYDFGFINKNEFYDYTCELINTFEKLQKWNGHLYNWYDTKSLNPLPPLYISTVDSGNFTGYLITLAQAIEKIKTESTNTAILKRGISDTAFLAMREGYKINLDNSIENIISQINANKGHSVWLKPLKRQLEKLNAPEKEMDFDGLLASIDKLFWDTDFKPLYSQKRGLFHIGYNISEGKATNSYYDLLASEARQASFVAIAKGDVPTRHWFRLSRTMVVKDGFKGLASWSGTMFEYFMPLLIMKNIKNTLMDETYKFVLKAQLEYGKRRNVPWGVSESTFAAFDMKLNYQYKAFGIPELGFKRGLGEDTVISPYSSILGLMSSPNLAIQNLKRIQKMGGSGNFGFYESIDYTPGRQLRGGVYTLVKTYMVHHHGMSLLAIDNVLNNNIMQKRFHSSPMICGIEYILQEKIPLKAGIIYGNQQTKPIKKVDFSFDICVREIKKTTCQPAVSLLSNSTFCSFIDQNGCGYMKSGNDMLTRFRRCGDSTIHGMFIYIKNCNTEEKWSVTPYPMGENVKFKTFFHSHKAEFSGDICSISHTLEVAVSPEDSLEVRKLTLKNNDNHDITFEITDYMELVLGREEADIAHSAFGKLFISTEFTEDSALLAKRTKRDENEKDKWMFHKITLSDIEGGEVSYDTKRSSFLGRNRDARNPAAMEDTMPLAGNDGAPIDPIFALRCRIKINSGEAAVLYYVTGGAQSKEECQKLCTKYSTVGPCENVFEIALTRSRVVNKFLNISAKDEEFITKLLSLTVYPSTVKNKYTDKINKNILTQENLWKHGISGDLPVIIYIVENHTINEDLELILKAHEFFRLRGFLSDLIIFTKDTDAYNSPVINSVREIVATSPAREHLSRSGGVYIKDINEVPEDDFNLMCALARVIISGNESASGQLQVKEFVRNKYLMTPKKDVFKNEDIFRNEPEFFNGLGGFDISKNEYVLNLNEKKSTPMPWINVVANKCFGFMVSESGGGYTWYDNSRENKFTPWTNDFVTDSPGEIIYLKETNVWTTTKSPVDTGGQYVIRHGFGYTKFIASSYGILTEQTMFVHNTLPIKYNILKIKNTRNAQCTLKVIYYVKPVLGVSSALTSPYINVCEQDDFLYAKNIYPNHWNSEIYIWSNKKISRQFKTDENLITYLNGKEENGIEPCMAIETEVELDANSESEVVFALGGEYKTEIDPSASYTDSVNYWAQLLGKISVKTSDQSMNIMLSGRLLYQNYCCRMLARSGFYQSSGANGFRDQLQDSMAMLYILPEVTKTQILLHAGRQFTEGDVQHWWHNNPFDPTPPSRGIRTKFSDDLVWLVYVTNEYIEKTGDFSILNEEIPFITEPKLEEDVSERYGTPELSGEVGSLYEHCLRALNKALKYGEHQIPLMGSGDWNDGMNAVGEKGQGESVWLAFFLYATLEKFISVCAYMKDSDNEERFKKELTTLQNGVNQNAWDGKWYRRAFFDDGTPLGSADNSCCRIDSISQTWSVISGAAPPQYAKEAMESLEKYLIDKEYGIVKLLTPPFENAVPNPGYISSYIPGVRENGGQYTHAAIWVILAYAILGHGDKAVNIFNMINPINHTKTPLEVSVYKTEPYALAADVYFGSGNSGQGGWTWYTGAAGWMNRVGLEYILGLKKYADYIEIKPCISKSLGNYELTYKYENAVYNINVIYSDIDEVMINNQIIKDGKIPLKAQGEYNVFVSIKE